MVPVRTRIILLAVFPVIGFLFNALAFTSGETKVASAFNEAKQAALLADASRDFKTELATLRMTVRDFANRPTYDLVNLFRVSSEKALHSLERIEATTYPGHPPEIVGVRLELE